eukprot:12439763-Alexandrium_andersonii.AAC.1
MCLHKLAHFRWLKPVSQVVYSRKESAGPLSGEGACSAPPSVHTRQQWAMHGGSLDAMSSASDTTP